MKSSADPVQRHPRDSGLAWPPHCDKCDEELERPGALALGPPSAASHSRKYHLCLACWEMFLNWMTE